jgi:drug/metabolite transporter (DMT)-like permease
LARDREQLLEIALVNYLGPALTILLSIPLLGKRCRHWLWPGTALAVTGVFLVTTQAAQVSWKSLVKHLAENPAPYALALAAAISWALYSNLTRRWAKPEQGGAVGWFLAAAGLVLLALRLATSEPTHWSLPAVGEATVLATVTVLAYGLWEVAMRRGNLLLVAAGSYFTPLLSTAASCLYLDVSPSPKLWIGCLLLVTGSLMTWRSVR